MIVAVLAVATVVFALDPAASPVARHLDLGKEQFQRGDYSQALDDFLWVLRAAPQNIEAKEYVTRIGEVWKQRLGEAELSPREREQALWDAVQLISAKKKRLAELDAQLEEIRRQLERGLQDPAGLLQASRSLSRFQEADLGERILAEQSQRYLTTLQKELRAAISANGTVKDPKDVSVVRGYLWYYRGDLDGALREWQRALALRPEDPVLSEQIAWVSKKKAVQERKQTIEKMVQRARDFMARRQYEQAVSEWHNLVILEPQDDRYQKALADSEGQWRKVRAGQKLSQAERSMLRGRVTEASRQFLEVLEIDPANKQALEQLKQIQQDLDRRVSKTASAKPVAKPGPKQAQAILASSKHLSEEQYTLGLIYYSQGDLEKARRALLAARDYDPGNEKAKNALERVLAELNP